jgi:hypothetical protein
LGLVIDPVRATRARIAGYVGWAKRLGYLLLLAAIVLYFVGLIGTFSSGIAVSAAACLIAGGVVLAPAIILGYAVNAAEREDRERGL